MSTPWDDDPIPLGEIMDDLRLELGLPEEADLSLTEDIFAQAIGPDVMARIRSVAVHGGVLEVDVDDPAIASLLRYQGQSVVRDVNQRAGRKVLERIKVRHS
ncbi:MAG: DUF721 domain-containing protein [Acidimicrobiia bacterium]|jgi:hypothetical protein|nr:DUF721 domain-containing protein [Acidimicrobiia bacterium]MBP8179389.1 DUF721 domain-containing protein [Acidimicrobiia bacterium]